MELDSDICYPALAARDARFDGRFFVGVGSTGIYCRPVCPARTPRRAVCRFFARAASAEAAGFRPCLRCRPELAPGLAPVDAADAVAVRALSRIEAGALNDAGIDALAAEFALSGRQLRRIIERSCGVSPVALAQTHRLLLAKQLLTDTTLNVAEIAFASGFSSVRRLNHLFRSRYGLSPTALRRLRPPTVDRGDRFTLRLGYRPPLDWAALTSYLAGRGAAGTEAAADGRYRRSLRLGRHCGWIEATDDPARHQVCVSVSASLLPALAELRQRLRRLFDLDADPAAIAAHLGRDPRLAPALRRHPGLRLPGSLDGFELALRAIIGQQISVKAATTVFGRYAAVFGEPIATPFPDVDRLPPSAATLADAPLHHLIDQGLTRRRAATVQALARAVAGGELSLDPAAGAEAVRPALAAIPGIGPWTVEYLAIRVFGEPDAFPDSDLGLLRALSLESPAELRAVAEAWRPWRAYAAIHLWNSLSAGG